ncbi:MAG TPA: glycosyltransferase, partial [Fibrobacteria bacterium]|nr:glycosyltransferase [Fibrobacteria bacterium]
MTPPPPFPSPRARVLSNVHLPAVAGYSVRTFGDYPALGASPGTWRAEMERRDLRDILPLIPAAERPDMVVCASPEYLPIPRDIHAFPGTKVLLITDWNVCLRFLPDLLPLFDFAFVDWPGYRLLRRAGFANVHHQPLFGHDPEVFRDLSLPRTLDVSFCGNLNSGLHGERNRLAARLALWAARTDRLVHLRQAFGPAYVEVLNRSRLVFNYSVRGEANMRLFEAMACGAVPLVEESNQEAAILFQEGRHYFRYAPGRLEATVEALLARPERIAEAAEAARMEVARHTKARQLETLFATVGREAPSRSAGSTPPPSPVSRGTLAKIRVLG